MNNLEILKLSDNFDIWRDLINKAISHVNGMENIPDMSNRTSGFLISNELNDDGVYTLKWVNLVDMLNDLGINTGGSGAEFPTIGSYLPDGVTVGSTGVTYIKPNGDIENSGNILNHGNITSEGNLLAKKITSQTSLNAQNLELTASTPYIDFNYNNTTSDYTSRIIENKSGVLSINGNEFSSSGSSIKTDLRVYTDKNDVVFRNDDKNFYILFSGRNGTPNSLRPLSIDIATGLVTLANGLSTSSFSCTGNTSLSKNLTVSGTTTVNDKLSVSKNGIAVTGNSVFNNNVEVKGTLNVSTMNVENMKLNMASLEIYPLLKAGAGSNFVSDLYVNSSSNSLIIRNDASNAYLLVSDTVNGSWNSLRPFSFNMKNGAVSMAHPVTIGDTLTVGGKTTLGTTFVSTLQTYNSSGQVFNVISGGRVYNAVFNDYAEFFEKGEETEVGDIIALDLTQKEEKYVKATEDDCIVGVHSDTYGHILGGEESIEESLKANIPVGLIGRVKTKIIGSIRKGDKVVLSDIPGVGRKYKKETDKEKKIIGFVVETNMEENIKLVKMKLL